MLSAIPWIGIERGYIPTSLAPLKYCVLRGPGTLEMIRLNGGRTMPCILSIGVSRAGAIPIALIARIWVEVIALRARLPSSIDRWMLLSRSAGSGRSVPSLTITTPIALPPSAEAVWACLALRPTGTMETIQVSEIGRESLGERECQYV